MDDDYTLLKRVKGETKMSILPRDEFFTRIQERLGDDTSEESIAFLEDMTDTYNDLEKKANGDGTDWEKKYRENDEAWKKKYKSRFFHGGNSSSPSNPTPQDDPDEYDPENVSINDLFK